MYDFILNTVRQALREATDMSQLVPGKSEFKFPNDRIARQYFIREYGSDEDFKNIGYGTWVYDPPKKGRGRKAKSARENLGKKEGESEEQYMARVRELNKKFADAEGEIEGEMWRPLKNAGRYFGGTTDYSRSHEVSNMGRLRTIDFLDPMRSVISRGYKAPTRKAMQFHLDTVQDGKPMKTTPSVHHMVADAWLDEPEWGRENSDIEFVDGNWENTRADNLRYVQRKGRGGRPKREDSGYVRRGRSIGESRLRGMIRGAVRNALHEAKAISMAPNHDEINITDDEISTSWNNGVRYVGNIGDIRSEYSDDEIRSIFQQAIAFSSKPWQLQRMLNDYFQIEGRVV